MEPAHAYRALLLSAMTRKICAELDAARRKNAKFDSARAPGEDLNPLLQPFPERAVCVLFVCLFVFLTTDNHPSAHVDGGAAQQTKNPVFIGIFQ